jgi:tetratricopeptide (TPR) repeat protein
MISPLDTLLRAPVGFLETGLMAMQASLETAQRTIEALAGLPTPAAVNGAPVNGPTDVDSAVSDLANRALRMVRQTPLDLAEMPRATRELIGAAQKSFRFVNWLDPRSVLLPLRTALSAGSLATQSGLRVLAAYRTLGARRLLAFADYVAETFCDAYVYLGVHYPKLIERYHERLVRVPQDAATRLELGRVYNKLGLYRDAARELTQAAEDPAVRALALHEAAVAEYRSGHVAEAVRQGVAALNANPGNERARAWLWLSAQKTGGYPAEVPEAHRMSVKAGYAPASVEFEDIAATIGLDKTCAGRGMAVFDYNNDGYLDVAIAAASGGCSLYRNNGDGTFSDVSIESGLDRCVNGFVLAVGDYNNDGYQDLFVTSLGFFYGEGTLYRNNGDGTFSDVTKQAGIHCWGPAFAAQWVDYDCDGLLDLFVCNNMGQVFERRLPNRLFHNNGDGTFTEVCSQVGIHGFWPTIGGAWGDYDNDGYPDLFLSNALGGSQLFRNNRDGTFTDVTRQAGIRDDHCFGGVCFWLDYDNDGWLDVARLTWSDHEDVIHTLRHGEGPADGRPMRLYRNNRDGTFTRLNREIGLSGCWGTMSGNAGDLDNDGYLDLVLGNGGPRMDRLEPLVLMQNDGRGKFRNVTFSAGLPFTGKSHGTTLADLFGDGRLSILVASGGAYPGDLLTASVYCPKRLPGNYLNVRLVGTKSNRDAIGARIALQAGGRRQYREVSGGSSFGCLPFEQHFGLGDLTAVDSLEIRWPSGLRQRLEHLPINGTIRITEGLSAWADVYQARQEAAL